MRSAVLCYAAEDADLAHELAGFIKLNCPAAVFEQEGLIGPNDDLLDTAERALSADYLLVLLSPDSVPDAWVRERWERILVDGARNFGTQVACVLLRACKFPGVLRRKVFFDLSDHRLAGQRALKRWLLRQDPFFETAVQLPERSASAELQSEALDDLECRLADQPGVQADVAKELALAFAHISADDFECVFWLNCANRSRAGILGDTAQLLHLKLRGTLEQNAQVLQEFCATRRLLFVFEHVAPSDQELVAFGGKTSVIFVAENSSQAHGSLEETGALFSHWKSNLDLSLNALGNAQYHMGKLPEYSGERWHMAISLGLAASSCLKHAGRLAEADELLELMIRALQARGDLFTAAQLEWERSWILEEWGVSVPPRAGSMPSSQPIQLSLGLSE